MLIEKCEDCQLCQHVQRYAGRLIYCELKLHYSLIKTIASHRVWYHDLKFTRK